MNIDAVLLGVKNVGFECTIPQSDIKDEKDKEKYWSLGYPTKFTKSEFEAMFEIDADKVFLCKSPGISFFYFNEETMAAVPLPLLLLMDEARVLFLSLVLADQLNLSTKDRETLATAAIFHDVRRENDGEDSSHGLNSRLYYERITSHPDPFVSFLCEYHCLPDKEGEDAVKSLFPVRADADRALNLYKVFKDADALDRVRFGLRDLDICQLRLEVSRRMPLVARLTFESLKVDE